jgi:hypothetical protein
MIDAVHVDTDGVGHAGSADEGRPTAIGGQCEQEENGGGVGSEPREPAIVEQVGLEPAKRRITGSGRVLRPCNADPGYRRPGRAGPQRPVTRVK